MALRKSIVALAVTLLAINANADDLESAKAAMRVKDFAAAAKQLNEGANKKSPAAQYLLATLYLSGLGVPLDIHQARRLLEAAATQGEPRAAFALASVLATEEPRDLAASQVWLDRAAELRFAPAVELKKNQALPLTFRPQSDFANDDLAKRAAVWLAATQDDVVTLQTLAATQSIKEPDEFGRTLLHRAAEFGAGGTTAWLLQQQATVNAQDQFGVTPLMAAAASESAAALHALVKGKANIELTDSVGNTALFYAARHNRVEQLNALLLAGADARTKNSNGWSAIDYALQADAKDSVAILRTKGANAVRHATNNSSRARSGEMLRAPAKSTDLYAGWSDLAIATTRDDPTLLQTMLSQNGVVKGNTDPVGSLLMVAATTQSAKSAAFLLSKGVDPIAANASGRTPLSLAVEHGDSATVNALINAGVHADAHAKKEPLPLLLAIRAGHESIARDLLTAGANPNAVDEVVGNTALTLAAQRGQVQTVQALLAAHAEVDRTDAQGRTALWYAANGNRLAVVVALLKAQAKVDMADSNGVTPLLQSCAQGHTTIVDQLLAAGANIRAKSKLGDTAVTLAAASGQLNVVQQLILAKPELDAQTSLGDTALIVASRAGHEKIVAALLQAGATTKLRNSEKVSAEDVARARGFETLAAQIEKH